MIKMKNCGDFIMELTVSGAQTTTAGSAHHADFGDRAF